MNNGVVRAIAKARNFLKSGEFIRATINFSGYDPEDGKDEEINETRDKLEKLLLLHLDLMVNLENLTKNDGENYIYDLKEFLYRVEAFRKEVSSISIVIDKICTQDSQKNKLKKKFEKYTKTPLENLQKFTDQCNNILHIIELPQRINHLEFKIRKFDRFQEKPTIKESPRKLAPAYQLHTTDPENVSHEKVNELKRGIQELKKNTIKKQDLHLDKIRKYQLIGVSMVILTIALPMVAPLVFLYAGYKTLIHHDKISAKQERLDEFKRIEKTIDSVENSLESLQRLTTKVDTDIEQTIKSQKENLKNIVNDFATNYLNIDLTQKKKKSSKKSAY